MIQPPKAPQIPSKLTHHGHTRLDHYYWMNQRDSQEVLAHIQAENAYTDEILSPVMATREELFAEIKGRIKQDDTSVPYRWNGYWYQSRYAEGLEYPIHVRWPDGEPEAEQVLLDENVLAEGQAYLDVADFSVSPDNEWLAYAADFQGRRLYTLYFLHLTTGRLLEETIEGTAGEFEWANDSKTLFFIHQEEDTLRNHQLLRYTIGSGMPSVLVWEEEDEAFDLSLDKTQSEQYLTCTAFSKTNTELRYLPAHEPAGEWRIFQVREPNHEYAADHLHGIWYIRSNYRAPNYAILTCTEAATERKHWQVMLNHRPVVMLEDFGVFDKWLVVEEREEGLMRLFIQPLDNSEGHYIAFSEAAYTVKLLPNPESDTDWLRYQYTSLTTPSSVVDYHMGSREKVLKKQQEVMGDFHANNYVSERLWATAQDGVQVPVSLVYRKDCRTDKPQALLLYGYGSYGISIDPGFSSARLSLLDRGFIFAIAHIRGGSEMGRWWYEEEGKFLHKKNTFTDFIACAEHLIKKGYTNPQHLYAMGGSAGGLLIGAVINMRPDLWRGVVGIVPFVDALTTMLDPSIPLTTQEYDEWGNPEDETYYRYMHTYSPYDNISEQAYPAVLAASGYHDSQVQYWEPAKWVARLRDNQQGKSPILLHMNFDAGHGGASGRFEQYKETALYYAFLLGMEAGKI